jgi:hypothetical protein
MEHPVRGATVKFIVMGGLAVLILWAGYIFAHTYVTREEQ